MIAEEVSKSQEEELEFKQFDIQDDEDIKKEKEEMEDKKNKKHPKNNSKLDNFIDKEKNKGKGLKPAAQKPAKIQLTLDQLANFKNQKSRRKSSE